VMDKDLRKRLEQAATRVANEAKTIASSFSRKIPAATHVVSDSKGVRVEVDAYVNGIGTGSTAWEYGANHPTNQARTKWGSHPRRSYVSPAVARKTDEAVEDISRVVDDHARRRGFRV
jgi:hypothetical protein